MKFFKGNHKKDDGANNVQNLALNHVAHGHHDLGGNGKFAAEISEHLLKYRDDENQDDSQHNNGNQQGHDGIRHGSFYLRF